MFGLWVNISTERRVLVPWLRIAMFQGQSTRLDCFSAEPTWSDWPVRRRSRCAAEARKKQAWDGFAKGCSRSSSTILMGVATLGTLQTVELRALTVRESRLRAETRPRPKVGGVLRTSYLALLEQEG